MLTHAGFLADIVGRPDDDAPRLIYADWLEDYGDPDRADFIRAQCQLARLGPEDPRRGPLRRLAEGLLRRHRKAWLAELPRLDGVWYEEFERGFVHRARFATAAAFLRHAPAVLAAAPVEAVRVLSLEAGPLDLDRQAALPFLARLREINLSETGLTAAVVDYLAGWAPPLDRLDTLLLHLNPLMDDGARCLADSTRWPHLRELYVSGCRLGDGGAAELAAAPHTPELLTLDLRDNWVADDGAAALAEAPHRAALETLYLVNNHVGPAGAAALAASATLRSLRHLYLNYNPIHDGGARALAASPRRAGLRALDLRNCGVGDSGARALARSPHLGGLTELLLTGNRIGSRVAAELRERFGGRVRV